MNRRLSQPISFGTTHRRTLHSVFALLWLSGALWLAFHYILRLPGEFGAVSHPLEIWWLRLHGLMGFAALIVLGSVLSVHVRRAWHLKRNRSSGFVMNSVFIWLAATGYALYYFVSEANAAWLPHMHWIVGLALPLVLVLHIRRGRVQPASVHRTENLRYSKPASQPHAFQRRQPAQSRQPL